MENREATVLDGCSKWMLESPQMIPACGWRGRQRVRVLVDSVMNEGCNAVEQCMHHEDSGERSSLWVRNSEERGF